MHGLANFLKLGILAQLACVLLSQAHAAAPAGSLVKWHADIKVAGQEANRTGKPILVQMTAPWCSYCHKMLRETYSDPQIARQVNEFFVPLLIDADASPQAVEILGIDSFPSTVIISPQFKERGRMTGFVNAADFKKKLAPYCTTAAPIQPEIKGAITHPASTPEVAAKTSAARLAPPLLPPEPKELNVPQPGSLTTAIAPQALALPLPLPQAPQVPAISKSGFKEFVVEKRPEFSEELALQPAEDENVELGSVQPPLAFNGMCLVSMFRTREVIAGKVQFEDTYRGVRLQFASAQELAAFHKTPEAFWPLLDGQCPVAKAYKEKAVNGDPEASGLYQGKLVFFRDEAHRDEFMKSPRKLLRTAEENALSR